MSDERRLDQLAEAGWRQGSMNGDLAHQLGLEQRHRYSDLDLALAGEKPLRAVHRCDLLDAFDESMLPIEVDVVDLNDVDVSFRSRIEPDFLLIKEQGEVML